MSLLHWTCRGDFYYSSISTSVSQTLGYIVFFLSLAPLTFEILRSDCSNSEKKISYTLDIFTVRRHGCKFLYLDLVRNMYNTSIRKYRLIFRIKPAFWFYEQSESQEQIALLLIASNKIPDAVFPSLALVLSCVIIYHY